MTMKFVIEHYEWDGWKRVPGATSTSLKDAENLKLGVAKELKTNIRNLSIVCIVDGGFEDDYEIRKTK